MKTEADKRRSERSRRASGRLTIKRGSQNILEPPKPVAVPDMQNKARRTKKRTMFASVHVHRASGGNDGGLMKLSRGDTQKADQLKAILQAKERQRARELADKERSLKLNSVREEGEEGEEGKTDIVKLPSQRSVMGGNLNSALTKEQEEDKKNADDDEIEKESMDILELLHPDHDPDATFLIIDSPPYLILSHDSVFAGRFESIVLLLVLFQSLQFPLEIFFSDENLDQKIEVMGAFTNAWDNITYEGERAVRTPAGPPWDPSNNLT